jgi:hypothetical protein
MSVLKMASITEAEGRRRATQPNFCVAPVAGQSHIGSRPTVLSVDEHAK